MFKDEEMLKSVGCSDIKWYALINNDGYKFTKDGVRYDLRHVVNVYGADCDYYTLDSITPEIKLYKSFNKFDDVIAFLKEMK